MTAPRLVADLVAALGAGAVKSAPVDRVLFARDAGATGGDVLVVVFPENTSGVAAAVRRAARHGVPIVVRGAGTGLAGGAVPSEPAMLLVTMRLDGIEVDPANRTAWVGPGVVNLDLSRHTAQFGLHFAPDPSSQAACTIGGNVASNSGGPHCLAEGTTTNHVLAVEFVDADGDIHVAGGVAPDPVGLDLRSVLIGSEGTLGVITRVLVRLTADPPAVQTLLFAFPEVSAAAATVSDVIAAGVVPAALEMMDRPLIRAVENFVHAGLPVDAAAILLAEVAGHPAGIAAESEVIVTAAQRHGAFGIRVAADPEERALLWKARKSALGAVAQIAPAYYLHDVVVPRTRLVEMLDGVYAIAHRHDLLVMNTIHAGDGNLHPKFLYDPADSAQRGRVKVAAGELVRLALDLGGALTGEHGIGLEKRDLMPLAFSVADLDAQARLRDSFDRRRRFNPGTMLPAGSRCLDLGRPVPDGVWA